MNFPVKRSSSEKERCDTSSRRPSPPSPRFRQNFSDNTIRRTMRLGNPRRRSLYRPAYYRVSNVLAKSRNTVAVVSLLDGLRQSIQLQIDTKAGIEAKLLFRNGIQICDAVAEPREDEALGYFGYRTVAPRKPSVFVRLRRYNKVRCSPLSRKLFKAH